MNRLRPACIFALALAIGGCGAILGIGDVPDPTAVPGQDAANDVEPSTCSDGAKGACADAAPGLTVDALVPASAYRGVPDLTVSVVGGGFVSGAVVTSGATSFATTFESGELSFVLPAARLATTGTIPIAVRNGDGVMSAEMSFVVSGCDPTGVDVPLGAAGLMVTRLTDLAKSTLTAYSPQGGGAIGFQPRNCPLAMPSAYVTKLRGFVVQNTTDAPLALSAWAVCETWKYTGFLQFYRRDGGVPTVPTTDAELLACTGHAAAGVGPAGLGYGAPFSDNLDSSAYCPGLTVQNKGTIPLAACEKAVVVIEAWDSAGTFPAPKTIRFRVDKP